MCVISDRAFTYSNSLLNTLICPLLLLVLLLLVTNCQPLFHLHIHMMPPSFSPQLPGYYVPASLLPIVQCAPPSSERCTGWDASMGVTACGAGYRPGSIGCGACAPGYYTALDQSCSPCPANGSILPLLYPLFSFIAATVGFAGLNYGLIVAAVRIAGGTVYGGTNRSLQLMIWIFTVVQLLAQVRAVQLLCEHGCAALHHAHFRA